MIVKVAFCHYSFCCSSHVLETQITVGINGASVSPTAIDQFRDAAVKPGIYAGVFMQVPLGKSFIVQPEVLYSAAGFTEPYDPADYVGNFTYHFNYLSVPVLSNTA